ncbi:MAG: MFS transporter [Acidobacteriota bacterium]
MALKEARIPRHALAVLEALRFDGPWRGRLRSLDDAEFRKVLAFCDPAQLTLTLDYVCGDALPAWVRARIRGNVRDYSRRFERLRSALFEIAAEFERRGIEFVALKGMAHSPDFTPDPLLRVQGDIDLWCRPDSLAGARQALVDLGYRAIGNSVARHLAPMVRDRDWHWRGDYFASDLPVAVELHYKLWDGDAESIPVPPEREFWNRRRASSLSMPDTLAFASLHLLMHLLHGDPRLQRAWEIAHFLDRRALDGEFWETWREWHPEPLRRLEAVVFRLVSAWFGCNLSPHAEEEIERLPRDVKLWLERHAQSPIEALFNPNKHEIWLHFCLAESTRDKCAILLRRVAPAGAAARGARPLSQLAPRFLHHARALVPTILGGFKWWWLRSELGAGYLRFQAASALFCLGMSAFFLLYNLHLLALGFDESFLGKVSSAMSLGALFGALPAAALTRRLGLRPMLLIAILGGAAAASLRALYAAPASLLASAFLNGCCMSFWAVSFSPAVAGLSNARNRQLAFSLACAAGMSIGILGGIAGGALPGALGSKQAALLAAAAFAALGAVPAAKLRFEPVAREEARIYPRSRFLAGFLAALCCWSIAVGMFNPFYNAFFSVRLGIGIARIGLIHSCAQLFQVLAVLAAPLVLKRLGDVRGIASMQLSTGVALVLLAVSPAGGAAALAYTGYVSFQYMSEPGMFKMLMTGVAPAERSGASSLYFLVTSLAASLSALAGGSAIARLGYPLTLVTAAALAIAAAFLFRTLLHDEARAIASPTSS